MKNGFRAALAGFAAAVTAGPAAAAALVFGFSFSNTSGNFDGTVTGIIRGLQDNMSGQAAASIVLTSDGGLPGIADAGNDVVDWFSSSAHASNRFDVFGGQIVYALAIAYDDPSEDYFCLLTDLTAGCGTLGGVGSALLTLNQQDPDPDRRVIADDRFAAGITFTPIPIPVPAPAGLLAGALLGIGLLRIRGFAAVG